MSVIRIHYGARNGIIVVYLRRSLTICLVGKAQSASFGHIGEMASGRIELGPQFSKTKRDGRGHAKVERRCWCRKP